MILHFNIFNISLFYIQFWLRNFILKIMAVIIMLWMSNIILLNGIFHFLCVLDRLNVIFLEISWLVLDFYVLNLDWFYNLFLLFFNLMNNWLRIMLEWIDFNLNLLFTLQIFIIIILDLNISNKVLYLILRFCILFWCLLDFECLIQNTDSVFFLALGQLSLNFFNLFLKLFLFLNEYLFLGIERIEIWSASFFQIVWQFFNTLCLVFTIRVLDLNYLAAHKWLLWSLLRMSLWFNLLFYLILFNLNFFNHFLIVIFDILLNFNDF